MILEIHYFPLNIGAPGSAARRREELETLIQALDDNRARAQVLLDAVNAEIIELRKGRGNVKEGTIK